MRWILAAVLAPGLCLGAALPAKLDLVIASAKKSRATWGLQVVQLSSGRVIYQRNPAHFLAPASNTKLFSTALALMRLGADYRFHTAVRTSSAPDSTGRIAADVEFTGGGDPSLSGRTIPYDKDAKEGNPLLAIEALADSIAERGIRRIDGDIVGDDTAYFWEPYPEGWTIEDALWHYGAPVGALVVNDNALTLKLKPGKEVGDPAELSLVPAIERFVIHNRVETTASRIRRIQIDRLPGERELHVWGSIPLSDSGYAQPLAAGDPAEFAAELLYDALIRRGVAISGRAVARHRRLYEPAPEQGGIELARRTSPPLIQLIQIVNKVSQNLHAEILLREVSRVKRGTGSAEAALEELGTFLKEAGITPEEYRLSDGSGLSRQDKLTPSAIVKLLVYMHGTPHRDAWMDSLPIGGEDGTLKLRFQQSTATKAAGKQVRAKTGTLGYARSLSGYAASKTYGRLAFSVMVNNFADTAEIREIVDKIGVLLTQ